MAVVYSTSFTVASDTPLESFDSSAFTGIFNNTYLQVNAANDRVVTETLVFDSVYAVTAAGSPSGDQEITALVGVRTGYDNGYVCGRCSSGGNFYMLTRASSTVYELYRYVGNSTGAPLTSWSITTTDNSSYTVKLRIVGTGATVTITPTVNGTTLTAYNDTNAARLTTGYPGIGIYDSSININSWVDDIVVDDLTGGGGLTLTGANSASAATAATSILADQNHKLRSLSFDSKAITVTSGSSSLAFGTDMLSYQFDGLGSSPITGSFTTATAGSNIMVIVGVLSQFSTTNAPTDSYSNAYTQVHQGGYFGGLWSGYGLTAYRTNTSTTVGGSGHTISITKTDPVREITLFAVELRGGPFIVQGSGINNVQANGANQPHSGPSVTVTGPALLISFWSGDGVLGTNPMTATPSSGWTKIRELGIPSDTNGHIQGAMAIRSVSLAGTYNCIWTPGANQGSIINIIAIQKV